MKYLKIFICASALMFALSIKAESVSRCVGADPCDACSTCSSCKHCNGGEGSCGVCGGGGETYDGYVGGGVIALVLLGLGVGALKDKIKDRRTPKTMPMKNIPEAERQKIMEEIRAERQPKPPERLK